MTLRAAIEDAARAGLNNYVNFEGRAARAQFWYWVLFTFAVGIVLTIVDAILGTAPLLAAVADVALLLPSLAFGARRLHDVGKSGWYLLALLIPLAGAIYLIYLAVQPGEAQANRWGAPPLPSA